MSLDPGIFDFPLRRGSTFQPAIEIDGLDLSGGQSLLEAVDALGNLVVWMGTAGLTAPDPAPALMGTLSIVVTGSGDAAVSTITGSAPANLTGGLELEALPYQWDVFDAGGAQLPALSGNICVAGRSMT